MEQTKSYYAIIPANVRYDKDLTPNAKLLYGEITALCNEKGYCWATNEYFAKLYNTSKTSISKWIGQLIKKKYIYSQLIYKGGTKEILNRYLRIVNDPIEEKLNTPIEEKLKENNTSFNNTVNNTNTLIEDFFEECWTIYPNKKGKGQIKPAKKKKAFELGEEFKRCIERYKESSSDKSKEYLQHGSTFWNGGYVDYLDKNFVEEKKDYLSTLPTELQNEIRRKLEEVNRKDG